MNYYDIPCTNPWWNMAFDEWLLQNGPDEPVFRLWRNEPSVIIGHNQVAAQEVNLEYLQQHGIKLARRVTGGGAVYHDLQNMNYSFAGPIGSLAAPEATASDPVRSCAAHPSPPDGWAPPSNDAEGGTPLGGSTSGAASAPLESSASGAPGGAALFASALRSLGVPAELSGRNDIFVEGRKISGYARSVWHNRELVHGTLMYNVDIDTLTAALNVEGSSKLNLKGVASVRSRVTNVRDYLPQFSSLDELQSALQATLMKVQNQPKMHFDPLRKPGESAKSAENELSPSRLELSKSQLTEIDKLASEKFASSDWIYKQ